MRATEDETDGVWDRDLRAIIVRRTQLRSIEAFAGTLLHEFGHGDTGAVDCTRRFENVLTEYLGRVTAAALSTGAPGATETSPRVTSRIPPSPQRAPVVIEGIEFIPVESSAVAGVAYEDTTQTLYVAMKKGLRYLFPSVPKEVYIDFLNAESKGRYLGAVFARYRYQEMN
jgi:hypothetical protein